MRSHDYNILATAESGFQLFYVMALNGGVHLGSRH